MSEHAAIADTTDATFASDVKNDLPVLVDFWAPWCGPCKALAPHLEQLAAEYSGRLKVLKLNIDEAPGGSARLGVRSIPTLIFYANGEERERLTGPSTMRLRMAIEKQFHELGLEIPVTVVSPAGTLKSSRTTADNTVPISSVRLSFGADPLKKAGCLARLREGSEEQQYRPSALMAGSGREFEAEVGVPKKLGDLLDILYDLQTLGEPPERCADARKQTLEIVETMPVGRNLSTDVDELFYELAFVSRWNMQQYFSEPASRELVAEIATLHRAGLAGETVASGGWDPLLRRAVLLVDDGVDDAVSRTVERLAAPLADWNMDILIMIDTYAARDYSRYPQWSAAEEAQMVEIETEARNRLRNELGEPASEGEARLAWIKNYNEQFENLRRRLRDAHPNLYARHDAWKTFAANTRRQVCAEVARLLQARLSA